MSLSNILCENGQDKLKINRNFFSKLLSAHYVEGTGSRPRVGGVCTLRNSRFSGGNRSTDNFNDDKCYKNTKSMFKNAFTVWFYCLWANFGGMA